MGNLKEKEGGGRFGLSNFLDGSRSGRKSDVEGALEDVRGDDGGPFLEAKKPPL